MFALFILPNIVFQSDTTRRLHQEFENAAHANNVYNRWISSVSMTFHINAQTLYANYEVASKDITNK